MAARSPSYTERESMRRAVAILVVLVLSWPNVFAAPRTYLNKIRYHGGSVKVRLDPWDWNTSIAITKDEIVLDFSGRATLNIKPSRVRSISFGEEAKRRVENVIALTLLTGPFGLFGLLHKTRDELVGIVYDTDDGKQGAVLLESPFAASILVALSAVTGKAVETK